MRVCFIQTTMIVGGAETLLVNLIRGLDRSRFAPELVCLKEPGPLGEALAQEFPVHSRLLAGKFDLRVLPRLVALLRRRKIDAVVTVGAGDKMFWGRLAAKLAGTPVVCAALHSTGWPDVVGRLNRMLTPWTDAFIGVAPSHGRFLVENERFPADRVHVIPNGINTERFAPLADRATVREELGLSSQAPVVGIVAALRPEKNHAMFLRMAAEVGIRIPEAMFLIVGDGPCRPDMEAMVQELGLTERVKLLGSRNDVPRVLGAMDVLTLTSRIEASPVSILEAMAIGLPVVATDVGSVAETVEEGRTGHLVGVDDSADMADRVAGLLRNSEASAAMGRAGREKVVSQRSLRVMVEGYQDLLHGLYETAQATRRHSRRLLPQSIIVLDNAATPELCSPSSR